MALDYLIGQDNDQGHPNRITELSYDATQAPSEGIGVKYCNLFDQRDTYDANRNTGQYSPYLKPTQTSSQYDEGVIDPSGPGWSKNLTEQFTRAASQGFQFVELDNPDAYAVADVIGATDAAGTFGLKVIAKNPLEMREDATSWLAHPDVFGVVVEKDCGSPTQMDGLRRKAGKPELPVWFVSCKSRRSLAVQTANEIESEAFVNMSVTYSPQGEYESSEDVLAAIPARTSQTLVPVKPGVSAMDTSQAQTILANIGLLDPPADGALGPVNQVGAGRILRERRRAVRRRDDNRCGQSGAGRGEATPAYARG
jgi:hypothetical protein